MDEPRRSRAGTRCRRRGPRRRLRARGWHLPYFDDISRNRVVENLNEAGGFLFGRRTYESFASYWPNASEEAWENSKLLQGDVAEAVAALKREDGDDLHVIGSTQLVQTLIRHGLVDELRLMIDPVVLGGGKRIFGDDGTLRPLRLADSDVTTTGAILATYAPAAD